MPVVDIKGVGKAQFPDDMPIEDIRAFLRKKYSQRAMQGKSDLLAPAPVTASPYEPTLTERLGGGIAEGLKGAGLISDNYGAQQIGKNVTALGEFLPGIGDATAGDEFGRAMQAGNYGEAALHAAGTVPVLGDMAIFAGALAKNADLGALKKAQALELQGKGRDDIWKETGWFNDKGDWKFEIDDSASSFDASNAKTWSNPDNTYSYQYDKSKNIVDHPELFGQYPSEGDINMRLDRMRAKGQYDPDNGIMINKGMLDNNDKKSTALHELQHAIQQREGFSGGGSPEMFVSRYNSAPERLKDASYSAELKSLLDEGVSESEILDLYKGMPEEDYVKKLWIEQKDFIKSEPVDYFNRLAKTAESDLMTPDDQYQRLAGEAEARLVQTRMNMTPEERRARPPWQDLDVPEDELIYRK